MKIWRVQFARGKRLLSAQIVKERAGKMGVLELDGTHVNIVKEQVRSNVVAHRSFYLSQVF